MVVVVVVVVIVVAAGQQPITRSSYSNAVHVLDSSIAAGSKDQLQIFVERAEKSGIKLEAVPESNT